MKNLLLLFTITFASISTTKRNFKKYFIGNTGCSIKMFKNPGVFKSKLTLSGDKMYYGSCKEGNITYGFISVHSIPISKDMKSAEKVLVNFIKNLHQSFGIKHTIGLNFETKVNDSPSLSAVTDYWQDNENIDWKVKGLTNGNEIVLLYVKNINEIKTPKMDSYLDSFRFSTK